MITLLLWKIHLEQYFSSWYKNIVNILYGYRFSTHLYISKEIAQWSSYNNGLQAGAPEGACHDNVKKCFTKNWEVFWNIFPFLHRWIWCDEVIKEYLKFYAYFTRMQKFFHFRRWEFFFQKTAVFFRKKNWFCFNVFCQCFFKSDWW